MLNQMGCRTIISTEFEMLLDAHVLFQEQMLQWVKV